MVICVKNMQAAITSKVDYSNVAKGRFLNLEVYSDYYY